MSIVTSMISGIFIPVKDVVAARDWYCSLFMCRILKDILLSSDKIERLSLVTRSDRDSLCYCAGRICRTGTELMG